MMPHLAIVGTRTLACTGDTAATSRRVQQALDKLKPALVISGGAAGVDTVAENVARANGYSEEHGSLIIHRPTVRQFHGPGGYRERDLRIATECTHLLRLSCRQATTYGSGWTADEALRLGKLVARYVVCDDGASQILAHR